MKKIIVHVVYLLIIGFLIVLSNIKSSEAQQQTKLAKDNQIKAERSAAEARMAAAEAIQQKEIADKLAAQLENCKAGK